MKLYITKLLVVGIVIVAGVVGGASLASSFSAKQAATRIVDSITVQRDIPTFTNDAAVIAVGIVEEIGHPYWNADHSMIQRDARLVTSQMIKGSSQQNTLSITLYGGTLAGETIVQEDAPELKVQQKILVFLGVDQEKKYVPYALSKGVYTFLNATQLKDSDGTITSVNTILTTIQQSL